MTRWLTMAAIGLLVACGAGSAEEPASVAAPDVAASQPDDDAPVAAPAVTKVELRAPSPTGIGAGRSEPADDVVQPAKGAPLAIPTGEQLVEEILKTAGAAHGAAGNVPTSEDVRRSLSTDSAVIRVPPSRPTVPSKVEPEGSGQPGARLLPEGHVIRNRVGFVRRDRGRFVFAFEDNTGQDQPITLLPNSNLESLLAQSHNATENLRFRVTGTVTQYQRSNYLLLQMVLIEQDLGRF